MNPDLLKFFEQHRQAKAIPYYKGADAKHILHKSRLPYLPIQGFRPPIDDMHREAQRLIPMMVEHRTDYENHSGWKSLVLHGLGATMTAGAEHYGKNPDDPSIYNWTEIASLAPITTAFFREVFKYEHYQRIRFMLLEPGGYICPHNDVDYYMLGPVNMALNNPHGCDFVMEGVGVLPFEPGSILKLALINRHAVFNNSDEPRLHIIVHGSPDPDHWNPLVLRSYQKLVGDPRFQAIEN